MIGKEGPLNNIGFALFLFSFWIVCETTLQSEKHSFISLIQKRVPKGDRYSIVQLP